MLNHSSSLSEDSNKNQSGPALVRDDVYQEIRADILNCVLPPGGQVFENDLANRYRVSKSPVRDALLRLQEQGLIRVLPRKGYLISPISIKDVHDLYEMRLLLEKSSIRRACEDATDQGLASLNEFREVDSDNLADWVLYNRKFHRVICELSGNSRMARIAAEIIDQFDRLTFVGVSHVPDRAKSGKFVEEHCAIIDALQQRDRSRATRLITKHITKSQKRLFSAIRNQMVTE